MSSSEYEDRPTCAPFDYASLDKLWTSRAGPSAGLGLPVWEAWRRLTRIMRRLSHLAMPVAILCAGLFFIAAPVNADRTVPISAMTGHNNWDNWGGNMADLTGGTISGMGQPAPTAPSTWIVTNSHYSHEWQAALKLTAAANGKIGWVTFDLGSTTANLTNLYIWNLRGSTTSRTVDYNVYHTTNPTVTPPAPPPTSSSVAQDYDFASGGWTLLNGAPLTLPMGSTPPAEAVVDLGGISARYVAIEILSNAGGCQQERPRGNRDHSARYHSANNCQYEHGR